nr:MAG TPA: protein of unknown function (DUF3850) [Caudoviricetes sp.]
MLIFPLKKQWYEKIKSGEKTIEYREVKKYWETRLWHEGCLPIGKEIPFIYVNVKDYKWPILCYFQLGYKPETRIEAFITKVEIIDGQNTDLKTSCDVYAIHFKLSELEKTKKNKSIII